MSTAMQARRAEAGKRPREDAALGACAAEPTPCAGSSKLARLSNARAAPSTRSADSHSTVVLVDVNMFGITGMRNHSTTSLRRADAACGNMLPKEHTGPPLAPCKRSQACQGVSAWLL